MFSKGFNKGVLLQYGASITGVLSVLACSQHFAWTSPYLPKLMSNSSTIPTTQDEGSWCVVVLFFGALFGALLASVLVDLIGRKNTILLTTPIQVFFCICLAHASTIYQIIIIRTIVGTVDGALFTVLPGYIAEICETKRRGLLLSTLQLTVNLGRIVIYCIGPFTSITISSYIILGIAVIHFILFAFMPESPYFLIKRKRLEAAEHSLKLLRGNDDIKEEFDNLCKAVERQEGEKQTKCLDLVAVPSNRRACLIFLILCCGTKLSGHEPLVFYSQSIFEDAESSIKPELATIIFAFVEFFATLFTIIFIDKFGKKTLVVISIIGCGVVLSVLSLHVVLKSEEFYPKDLNWVPLACVVLYTILYSIGLNFAQTCAVGELFPTNVKGNALAGADIFSNVAITITSKFFSYTNDIYGISVPFSVFSVCCFIFGIFIVKYVPETKGKSLEEIQIYLINKTSKKVNNNNVQKCNDLKMSVQGVV